MTAVVVTGSARGGTTAVAGAIKRLGVPFPDAVSRHENADLMRTLRDRYGADLTGHFKCHDEAHPMWAMKEPDFDRNPSDLFKLLGMVREPRVVYVWRDLFAIASNRSAGYGTSLEQEFETLWQDYGARKEALRWLQKSRVPVLHVSYEKLLLDPAGQILRIRDWLGLESPVADAVASITPGRYLD